MTDKYQCLMTDCEKTFEDKDPRKILLIRQIRVHYLDDHQANLFFVSHSEVLEMVKEIKE
jgi:hypothetical protein